MIKSNKNTSKIGDEGELDHLFLVNFHVFLVQFGKVGVTWKCQGKTSKIRLVLRCPKFFGCILSPVGILKGPASSFQVPRKIKQTWLENRFSSMIFQFPIYFGDENQANFLMTPELFRATRSARLLREAFHFSSAERVAGCRLHPMAHDVSRCLDGIRNSVPRDPLDCGKCQRVKLIILGIL